MTTEIGSATEQLSERWQALSRSQRALQFRALRTGEKADFFLELSAHNQSDLLLDLAQEQRHVWMRLLAPDDVVDVIQEIGPDRREEMLSLLEVTGTKKAVSHCEVGLQASYVCMLARYRGH